MLAELRQGNPDLLITLLVATGLHRTTTEKELREKLGDEIVDNEVIFIHDANDQQKNYFMGTLPSGAPLYVDGLVHETDLLIVHISRYVCYIYE
jgi:nickel-dependent lactate racemase